MKKTEYSVMVNSGSTYCVNGIWRRVYITSDSRYVIKYNGETKDVTHMKDLFVKD